MNIVIVGTGYVGLVSGACFSDMGITVTCVDTNVEKIARLRRGVMPIYEAGLEAAVARNVRAGRLHFATDLAECGSDAEVIFCCVDTPPAEDGSADLGNVMAVARRVGEVLDHYAVIATKSTVPVGTTRLVERTIAEELSRRGVEVEFDVASNPEFLKEGVAVKDFMSPDRVVVGVESPRARAIMARLYKPFMLVSDRLIFTDIASAEMIKYASNSMLATRISFMNDVANLCEKVGADVNMVRKGVGTDTRIGNKFLYAGCGYGGSCFPKDVKALIRTAAEHGCRMEVLEAVERVNERQKGLLFRKLDAFYEGNLAGRAVALWGLAFKPETDDMREATALVTIKLLLEAGCIIKVFDPVAMNECKRRIGDAITYANDMYDAVLDADALLVLTEWKQFRLPSWGVIVKSMKNCVVVDGRNIYDSDELEQLGIQYYCIGK